MAKKSVKKRQSTKKDIRQLKTSAGRRKTAVKIKRALKGMLAKPQKKPTSVSLSEIRKAVRAVHGLS